MSEGRAKQMDVAEFRRLGYLQEVNRRFFHPLGLALAVTGHDGIETLGPVLDGRDDPEGYRFEYSSWPDPSTVRREHVERAAWVDCEWERRRAARAKALGYMIQPAEDVMVNGPEETS